MFICIHGEHRIALEGLPRHSINPGVPQARQRPPPTVNPMEAPPHIGPCLPARLIEAHSGNQAPLPAQPWMPVARLVQQFLRPGVAGGEVHLGRRGEGRDESPLANDQFNGPGATPRGSPHERAQVLRVQHLLPPAIGVAAAYVPVTLNVAFVGWDVPGAHADTVHSSSIFR